MSNQSREGGQNVLLDEKTDLLTFAQSNWGANLIYPYWESEENLVNTVFACP